MEPGTDRKFSLLWGAATEMFVGHCFPELALGGSGLLRINSC
jgi:hypothetical protein